MSLSLKFISVYGITSYVTSWFPVQCIWSSNLIHGHWTGVIPLPTCHLHCFAGCDNFNISRSLGFSPKFILVATVLIFMNSIFNYPKYHCYSVMSNSFLLYGLQHTRHSCPSPSARVCSNSCPLSWGCHPTISSSVIPFSCLQSFPASGSFPMSQLFASGGQSTGAQLQHQSFQWIFRTDSL